MIASLKLSAVSSLIKQVTVNCDSFSLHRKISCPSFLITSTEKFAPKTGVSSVDWEKISFGRVFKEAQRVQELEISSMILEWPAE